MFKIKKKHKWFAYITTVRELTQPLLHSMYALQTPATHFKLNYSRKSVTDYCQALHML